MANTAELDIPIPKKPEGAPPAQEGAPSWMVTFADLMSLLLCFFVLLLSFSSQNTAKFEKILGSLKYAFGVVKDPNDFNFATMPGRSLEMEKELSQEQKQVLGLVMILKRVLEQEPDLEHMASVSTERSGANMRIQSGVLFEENSAKLTPQAKQVLEKVRAVLTSRNFNLAVRGHTDNSAISGIYGSNWELSAARAAVAAQYLIESDPALYKARVKAVGYADARPLVPNSDAKNKFQNRRLEFYFHKPDAEMRW
ncbi:MAG: OmpA family protein [Okeania sp. SIO3B3]|nr:OmpA family protein [Okeania sp. SIO3B3]